jgi:transposase
MVVSGILFWARAGGRWRDLPGEYGDWKTVCDRYRGWSLGGTGGRILAWLLAGCGEAGGGDWAFGADSAVVRADRRAAGARPALAAELIGGGTAG